MGIVVKMTGPTGHSVWLTGDRHGERTFSVRALATVFGSSQDAHEAVAAIKTEVNAVGLTFSVEEDDPPLE